MTDTPRKGSRTLQLEVHLPADPDVVWKMLTDPKELAQWFAPFVESTGPGVHGDVLTLGWGPEVQWRSRLDAAEPGRRVRWIDPSADPTSTEPPEGMVVEWTLAPERGGTRLRLVNSGFGEGPDWDDQYDATHAGWRFFLWHLEEVLRLHRAERRVMVSTRRASHLSREALGARLYGPEGLALEPPSPTAGSTARLRLGAPQQIEVTHARLPTHLWGRLPGLGGAVLLIEMEPGGDGFHTGFWISTWRLGADAVRKLQAALDGVADAVFGPPPA